MLGAAMRHAIITIQSTLDGEVMALPNGGTVSSVLRSTLGFSPCLSIRGGLRLEEFLGKIVQILNRNRKLSDFVRYSDEKI